MVRKEQLIFLFQLAQFSIEIWYSFRLTNTKIAVDNLIHIAVIILLGIGLIFIIEGGRNKKDVPSEKTGEEKVSE